MNTAIPAKYPTSAIQRIFFNYNFIKSKMKTLSKITKNIRSKNAGPFWVTVDLFFKDKDSFFYACKNISNEEVSNILKIKRNHLKRFDIENLKVIKFSFPRKNIQGSRLDRDMHGASFAILFEKLSV